jgi:hypothetical protein
MAAVPSPARLRVGPAARAAGWRERPARLPRAARAAAAAKAAAAVRVRRAEPAAEPRGEPAALVVARTPGKAERAPVASAARPVPAGRVAAAVQSSVQKVRSGARVAPPGRVPAVSVAWALSATRASRRTRSRRVMRDPIVIPCSTIRKTVTVQGLGAARNSCVVPMELRLSAGTFRSFAMARSRIAKARCTSSRIRPAVTRGASGRRIARRRAPRLRIPRGVSATRPRTAPLAKIATERTARTRSRERAACHQRMVASATSIVRWGRRAWVDGRLRAEP